MWRLHCKHKHKWCVISNCLQEQQIKTQLVLKKKELSRDNFAVSYLWLQSIKVHCFHVDNFHFSISFNSSFLFYLIRVSCCSITFGVGRLPQRDPLPSLIEGHNRLHRAVCNHVDREKVSNMLIHQLEKTCANKA